ncbi:uncharacterized protein AMSG_01641 [Thecamonas trahens ATCC 50062]|uniref:Uncharacterized protein n=1 Tax=Thecamonas trahens ATCC 50062 TaxID=461836 RepID=A0A0L0DR51_THETB|nr:hypothetical protein AMSG_01641 [Thecamonas trahens ATCC 50062]KNC54789.1 hypothetical protein AMSG_01641 [Thecamonas trahens ATCC 50062]|eukprot:XP_013761689.1 hypothetical protein AMSG_01641 [Thecamonas trahens ATCC 50062]
MSTVRSTALSTAKTLWAKAGPVSASPVVATLDVAIATKMRPKLLKSPAAVAPYYKFVHCWTDTAPQADPAEPAAHGADWDELDEAACAVAARALGADAPFSWRGEEYFVTTPRLHAFYGVPVYAESSRFSAIAVVFAGAAIWIATSTAPIHSLVYAVESWLKSSVLLISAFIHPSIFISSTAYELAGKSSRLKTFGPEPAMVPRESTVALRSSQASASASTSASQLAVQASAPPPPTSSAASTGPAA